MQPFRVLFVDSSIFGAKFMLRVLIAIVLMALCVAFMPGFARAVIAACEAVANGIKYAIGLLGFNDTVMAFVDVTIDGKSLLLIPFLLFAFVLFELVLMLIRSTR